LQKEVALRLFEAESCIGGEQGLRERYPHLAEAASVPEKCKSRKGWLVRLGFRK
jgi:hypothetical protein